MKQRITSRLAALAAAAVVVACGGGNEGRVIVVGDSLSDSGTFGLKFTVQGTAATGSGSSSIWPEIVASRYNGETLCAHYRFNGATFATEAACTNYAIGGGRINNASNPADPRSIPLQLKTAADNLGPFETAGFLGAFDGKTRDLLLIDGGGNDAADLAGAYLALTTDGGVSYRALLVTLLDETTVDAALATGADGAAAIGGAYMQGLADKFADDIQTHALGNGAKRVVVLNLPDIALTPRFSAVLLGVALKTDAGTAALVKGLIQQWVDAFNARLAERFAGHASVAVVDFNANFRAQVADPESAGLTNAMDAACPVVDADSSGLPVYDFPSCTAAALSAAPPQGATGGADWWKTYLFSDGFHPTPKGHELAAAEVKKVLAARGW